MIALAPLRLARLEILENGDSDATGALRMRHVKNETRHPHERDVHWLRLVMRFDGFDQPVEFTIAAITCQRHEKKGSNQAKSLSVHSASRRTRARSRRGIPNSPPRSAIFSGSMVPTM